MKVIGKSIYLVKIEKSHSLTFEFLELKILLKGRVYVGFLGGDMWFSLTLRIYSLTYERQYKEWRVRVKSIFPLSQ